MNFDEFLKEKEKIEKLSIEEQKKILWATVEK